jgi:alpha-L-rhamnosidase
VTAAPEPRNLLVNGAFRPIGVGPDAPTLSWRADSAQHGAQVVVLDHADAVIWDSGMVSSTLPELRYGGPPLTSRTIYRWRVRTITASGQESPWSAIGEWETPLLRPEDWRAHWIGRHTPPSRRITRSITSDHVAWIEPGHWLGQTFTVQGPIMAVSVGLAAEPGSDVVGRLELCRADGEPIAGRELRTEPVPWDYFCHFLELAPAAPAGEYLVRVSAEQGRIGWRTCSETPRSGADDGVSPLAPRGTALRDGLPETGVRAVGIETTPAPNPIFRTSFTVPAGVTRARLHAVGLGYGAFRVNGREVSDDVLDPAPTDYDHSILYRSHNVTHLLRPGVNSITAALGRGFHSARGASVWAWNLAPWHREPVLLAQLEYLDGTGVRHIVTSDAQWQTAAGPVASDLLYTGETHGQAEPEWEPAVTVAPPRGVPRPAAPIRRFAPVAPVTSRQSSATVTVHDFGDIFAGRVQCVVSGEVGAQIIVRYGEHMAEDGSVQCENVLVSGEAQVDRYVLASSEVVKWEPEFGYKGFRYASVETVGDINVSRVEAIPLHTDVARMGRFECGNEILTWIDAATGRTFLNNLHGIPTDTPIYEKNGWTADAHLATEAVLHHFDLRATFGKWLDDHVDAQDDDGTVPQIVPTPGWGRAPDPAWSASMVLIPWNLYWEYGDLAILDRYAEPALKYTDRMLDIAGDGLWPHHSWGDWVAPGHSFAPEGPVATATMMLHHVATRAADICRELGLIERATGYQRSAHAIAAAYHETFFDERTGSYRARGTGYRQTMNILPLAFDAVPSRDRARVAQSLFEDIEHRTGGHLDCGAIGVKYLLPVLSDHGRDDLAITVATRRTAPGWGAWWNNGAKTLLESWDENARSHNHYFLGSSAAWIQQRVGGLRATSPGWSSFDIQPITDDRVTWARLFHDTVRGEVALEWRRSGAEWKLDLCVPPGATAMLRIAGLPTQEIASGVHTFRE